MNVKPWVFGALAFLVIRGSQKFAAVQRFVYDISGFPTIRISGTTAILSVNLLVSNKSPEQFNVTKIYSRLYSNGSYVGDITTNQPFVITGNGFATIPLTITLSITNAVTALIGALNSTTGGLTLRFDGFVSTTAVTIPLSFEKKLR